MFDKSFCTVKEKEGLGFKNMHQLDMAMLEKQGWRIVIIRTLLLQVL